MEIFLIGMMGAGKSTIGCLLADSLGLAFLDTDALISERMGKSISCIFADEGEEGFREMESELLSEIQVDYSNYVCACGGGLPIYNENMKRIAEMGVSIYLKADVGVLLERISENTEHRPLLDGCRDEEKLNVLLREREEIYSTAEIIVDSSTDGHEVTEHILSILNTTAKE